MVSMTAVELRDRLDDRFRLLVGSRRGLERHQTLRHAVQWSYDLLDDDEKSLLARCSVFAGGFDLRRRLRGGRTPMTTSPPWTVLDALVRKSLLVADRSSGRTRFSMLETIRQFAEEQLVAYWRGDDDPHRACPLLRRTRGRCDWPCGTVPRQRESLRLVHPRVAQPARRVPVGRRPRRSRPRRRHRRLCGVARILGRAVRTHRRGPRSSSNPRRPSNTGGWHSST